MLTIIIKNLLDWFIDTIPTTIPTKHPYQTLDIRKVIRTSQKLYKVAKGEKTLKQFSKEYAEEFIEDLERKKRKSLGDNPTNSIIDNIFRDKVKPKVGSVVHCGLLVNQFEHSGIYIGYNKIAHLDGSGKIEAVSPEEFLNRLDGLNSAISIYVSCKDGKSIGSRTIADRARSKLGHRLKYSVTGNNCHMFTSGCLTGKFKNNDGFFSELEKTTDRILSANEWRVWDIPHKKK